jgi:hypothetical protein
MGSAIYYTLILFLFCGKGFGQELFLLEATSQPWSGGAAGSPPGINYSLKILKKCGSKPLSVEKLWIGKRMLSVQVSESNDTLLVTAVRYLRSRRMTDDQMILGEEDTPTGNPPVKYKGEGMLEFKVGPRTRHLVIKRFKSQPSLQYP